MSNVIWADLGRLAAVALVVGIYLIYQYRKNKRKDDEER